MPLLLGNSKYCFWTVYATQNVLKCNSIKGEKREHPEKCFVQLTKVSLDQQSFSSKYVSMEILFEYTTKILSIFFFQFQKKKNHQQRKNRISN